MIHTKTFENDTYKNNLYKLYKAECVQTSLAAVPDLLLPHFFLQKQIINNGQGGGGQGC